MVYIQREVLKDQASKDLDLLIDINAIVISGTYMDDVEHIKQNDTPITHLVIFHNWSFIFRSRMYFRYRK